MPHTPIEARLAATVMVVRDSGHGPEVLVVERRRQGFFGGLTAFPGGGVEECDSGPLSRRVVRGVGEDHHFRAAALRELAEETSLALTTSGVVVSPRERGEGLYTALSGLYVLDGESLVFVSRWITPEDAPSRYDTMFYLAAIEGDPELRADATELVGVEWVIPTHALDLHGQGKWEMFAPTVAHLAWLAGFHDVEGMMSAAVDSDESLVRPAMSSEGIDEPGSDRPRNAWR